MLLHWTGGGPPTAGGCIHPKRKNFLAAAEEFPSHPSTQVAGGCDWHGRALIAALLDRCGLPAAGGCIPKAKNCCLRGSTESSLHTSCRWVRLAWPARCAPLRWATSCLGPLVRMTNMRKLLPQPESFFLLTHPRRTLSHARVTTATASAGPTAIVAVATAAATTRAHTHTHSTVKACEQTTFGDTTGAENNRSAD